MKQLLTILLLGLCLVSCNRHSEHWGTLISMETIIEERPDSVLNVLQDIDTDELVGDEERAKHALLLSMALAKCGYLVPIEVGGKRRYKMSDVKRIFDKQ